MYRQIWIRPSHQDYQKILWRRKPEDPITEFRLKTVTYGTASAAWLATRSLKWIADNEQKNHPEAAKIIANDFYMDDLLSGADSPEDAHRIQEEVKTILLSYGLPLRKWASNNEYVIRAITGDQDMMTNPDEVIKTLGLRWNSKTDSFQFTVKIKEMERLTKRSMISEIACTFDPLGLAAPVMILAKILYQEVWTTKTDWDDEVPTPIATKYKFLREKLRKLETLTIPRWVGTLRSDEIELHVFTDASEKAYGAAVDLRVIRSDEKQSNLVAAKTRVAPLSTVSIPRLELMGAVLETQLMQQVIKAFRRPVHHRFYWTDSTITLAWIKKQPSRFKTFVANRIATIQEFSNKDDLNHVRTKENPADLASRGIMPDALQNSVLEMWFKGPTWLQQGQLPEETIIPEAEDELKKKTVLHAKPQTNSLIDLIERNSSYNKLWRVIAWMLRFKNNCSAKTKLSGALTAKEKQDAFLKLVSIVEQQQWPKELKVLRPAKSSDENPDITSIMKTSSINNPFVDEHGVLRVGGRLHNSTMEFAAKHPVILHYGHFAKIYLQELHLNSLHAGPNLLLATARQQVWIVRGSQMAREIVKKCVECTRWKGETLVQQMGNLPKSRTEGSRAFHTVGVDYAGPMLLKNRKVRGSSSSKAWISVFDCFATKAVHLELVSELTSEGFIAALRRFISRRGLPQEIWSDNGTNFVGTEKELKFLLQEQHFQQDLTDAAVLKGKQWTFIPPSAPHMGGLWESAVKSVKHHLRRVLGSSMLTFEEFMTVLCQIESQLNSRPICPLSEDANDLETLTPGHFLIGQPITTAPDPNLSEIKENRLSRFQYLQRLQQEFWAKWHLEYLSSLQKRNKWKFPQAELKLDSLVLIKEDNMAPTQWRRGRIIGLHPGPDGKVRVVTLKTSNGEIKRPIVKIIPVFDSQ